MIIEQQISNHPLFPDVERIVGVYSQQTDSDSETFMFNFKIKYTKGGIDISNQFIQRAKSIFTSNGNKLLRRNEFFQPIPNSNYNPEEVLYDETGVEREATEYDMYLWSPGWDYIVELMNTEINIANLIRAYVLLNDSEQYFD